MNISAEQIQYIHDFVKRKYVDYYDVQIELVDHIATAIEEKIALNPKLDFYTALQQIYEGFGRFGFMKFVEEKEKQVQRRFLKMYRREMWQFFTVPKVVFTLAVFFLSYQLFLKTDYSTSKIVTLVVATSLIVGQFVIYFYEKRRLEKALISTGPPMTGVLILNIFNQSISLTSFKALYEDSVWWLPLLCTLIVIANFSNFMVSRKLRTEQRRLYPEAFVSVI